MKSTFPQLNGLAPNTAPARSGLRPSLIITVLVFIVLLVVGTWGISRFNAIHASDERAHAEWQNVVVQYQRRADLVPNLIAAVKSYAAHESRLFTDLAALHARVATRADSGDSHDATTLSAFQATQRDMSASLARLLAVADRYPELQASGLYRDLMAQLEGTENRIAYARARHVDAVATYNLAVRQFPGNLIAQRYGFAPRPAPSAELDSALRRAPQFESH